MEEIEIFLCAICDMPVGRPWGVYTEDQCLCDKCLERASQVDGVNHCTRVVIDFDSGTICPEI